MVKPPAIRVSRKLHDGWVAWLKWYGIRKFMNAFIRNAQGAESRCIHCHEPIYLDCLEGGGVPDWKTEGGDYGCERSPETNSEGCGGHFPKRLGHL